VFFNWLGFCNERVVETEDIPTVYESKSAIFDIARHPETGRWSFQVTYYDSTGELIGFNFFPISTIGLNEWFSHDEGQLGLRFNPVEKGFIRGFISALEAQGLSAPVLAAL
jgi:hypothetical protein